MAYRFNHFQFADNIVDQNKACKKKKTGNSTKRQGIYLSRANDSDLEP